MAEAKTFPEIWSGLDPEKKAELRIAVLSATRVSDVAYWRWCRGQAKPGTYPLQLAAASAVNKVLGTDYTYGQLFL